MAGRKILIVLAMGGVCAAAFAGGGVSSTFDTDAEGWSTDKDARDFEWRAEGGNPGGHVHAIDIGTGQYWRFAAPPAYLGDKSPYYGGSISYDMRQTLAVGSVINQPDIRLIGGGVTIEYRFGVAPSGEWSGFSAVVAAGEGWTRDDEPATEQDIRDALGALTELSIRGEYRVGSDSAALDNVFFDGGCAADFNGDGSVNFFDISDYIAAYNASDPSADVAEPFGTFNFFDISGYIATYNAGCP